MSEPGLDLHEWGSVWASVEEDLDADPAAALSVLADLVERMLRARGYPSTTQLHAAAAIPRSW